MPVLASAPVVDDSENFVLLEEQAQAAEELPVAQDDAYPITNDLKEATRNHATNPSSHTAAATARNIDFVNTLQSLQKEVQELRGRVIQRIIIKPSRPNRRLNQIQPIICLRIIRLLHLILKWKYSLCEI
ncbi:MAG: hypothetical protein NTZ86_07955 [Legionellales bacterium]|nr:hypothetical protein [Legionellales bacterium]